MRESDTYLAILDEGAERMAKNIIFLLAEERRFGPPSEAAKAALEAITDLEQLKRLTRRLVHVSSWDELFHEP